MTTQLSIDSILPDTLKGKYVPRRAFLVKVGFVELRLSAGLEVPDESGQRHTAVLKAFEAALYDTFEKSPNVLEITPPRGASTQRGGRLVVGGDSVSLLDALELRVALSEQQRKEYRGVFVAPEQFSILYDGRLFCAWSEVPQLGRPSSMGQAAREFLKAAASAQPFLKPLEGGGPTPLHSDIFLVAVDPAEGEPPIPENQMLSFTLDDDDLLVLFPAQVAARAAIRHFQSGAQFVLNSFYDARSACWNIDDKLTSMQALNDILSGQLATLFEHTAIYGVLRGIPRAIRRLLSKMHLEFQELSRLEIRLRGSVAQMNASVERNDILNPLKRYLNAYADDHDALDKDTQLRFMDYAGSEAVNVGVIQATIWASVIGALVGTVMTLLLS